MQKIPTYVMGSRDEIESELYFYLKSKWFSKIGLLSFYDLTFGSDIKITVTIMVYVKNTRKSHASHDIDVKCVRRREKTAFESSS